MTFVAIIICLLMAAVAAQGVVSPGRLIGIIRRFQTTRGIYFLAGLRLVLGVALLFSAAASRAPGLIAIIGIIAVIKGIIIPFISVDWYRTFLDRWASQGAGLVRLWALIGTAIGLGVAYAILP